MTRATKRGVTESDAPEYIPVKKLTIIKVTKKLPVSKKRKELEKELEKYMSEKVYTQHDMDETTKRYERYVMEAKEAGKIVGGIVAMSNYEETFNQNLKKNNLVVMSKPQFSIKEIVAITTVYAVLITLAIEIIYASIQLPTRL